MEGKMSTFSPYNAEIFVYKPWRTKGFLQLEINVIILTSSFDFI